MKVIHKYSISPELHLTHPDARIALPKGAEILYLREQDDIPCLWALVDPDETYMERRCVHLYMTGQKIPITSQPEFNMRYIGSAHLNNGAFVLHGFEVTPSTPSQK